MAKANKTKCKHGLSPIYVQGCPTCCMSALGGLRIIEDNGLTPELLFRVIRIGFPTERDWKDAIAKARAEIEAASEKKTNP